MYENHTHTLQGYEHSVLVQRQISRATKCYEEFSKYGRHDEYGNEIPIVLVPGKWCNLLDIFIPGLRIGESVPSGPYVLWTKWGRDMGALEPGVRWIWPFWKKISHIVSASTITYLAPSSGCPTADNVPVDVDVSLTFKIGPDVEAARLFVYRLGAHRFDEMLSAECEEAIRGLVYSVTHDRVNDLKEEFAIDMKAVLNEKFARYGVQILFVKVTDVKLPMELMDRLESTTAFKTKMGETEKTHENKVQILRDKAILDIETIRKTNGRMVQEIQAEKERYEIERKEMESVARGEAKVEIAKQTRLAEVKLKTAQANEVIAKIRANERAESLIRSTEIACQNKKIKAEKDALVMIRKSEAVLQVAEWESKAMIASEKAELDGAKALKEKRSYELEWKRLAILKKVAGHGRKFITDKEGEDLLNNMVPESELIVS
eukprot:CAMPEP_0116062486 /NCGR_PEP_ID=MMETSP0322-20121206/7788_1 /TAXON_ID=163516 /ORGANISM="Leptocylindrus danicus var. apora, Strain B651" /LENGTH=432 /DNA_ID=CAMNT_0003547803 /DNA_START=127 /DNA_END=1425 /DNA_ORIENTATION=+